MSNTWTSVGGSSSVDNALRLLELVGERHALRVSDAASLLGVAPSTAHRLLNSLRKRGFVLQDKPNGAYRPGPVLNEIGLAAIGRIDIRRAARPVLEELREQTRETVSLSLLEGGNVRFVDCVESPRSVRVGDRTGVVMPAHCTATGKAILAALPAPELTRRLADRELTAHTDASLSGWEELHGQLDSIREAGYAYNIEEGETGISAISTALRDLTEAPLASVSVVVPASRMPTSESGESFAPSLLRARDTIQEVLRSQLGSR